MLTLSSSGIFSLSLSSCGSFCCLYVYWRLLPFHLFIIAIIDMFLKFSWRVEERPNQGKCFSWGWLIPQIWMCAHLCSNSTLMSDRVKHRDWVKRVRHRYKFRHEYRQIWMCTYWCSTTDVRNTVADQADVLVHPLSTQFSALESQKYPKVSQGTTK